MMAEMLVGLQKIEKHTWNFNENPISPHQAAPHFVLEMFEPTKDLSKGSPLQNSISAIEKVKFPSNTKVDFEWNYLFFNNVNSIHEQKPNSDAFRKEFDVIKKMILQNSINHIFDSSEVDLSTRFPDPENPVNKHETPATDGVNERPDELGPAANLRNYTPSQDAASSYAGYQPTVAEDSRQYYQQNKKEPEVEAPEPEDQYRERGDWLMKPMAKDLGRTVSQAKPTAEGPRNQSQTDAFSNEHTDHMY
eukprot:Platyproteum_vivax@DN7045_c2_g1_i2.p1